MKTSAFSNADGEGNSLEVLWEDADRVFCRLWQDDVKSHRHAFIPVLDGDSQHPALESINRFTHEYDLKEYLDSSWALRPLDLVRERGRTMLVVEYNGGEPLDHLLGKPMEIGQFLRIATALSAALGNLHARGLLHRDIKPANVLADSVTGNVWLTGFGIASQLARGRQASGSVDAIAGTLAYMAPEQTGRMNLSVDARSDLYALGVTLYQMVTGVLPFATVDPMELVHCHIARQAVPPSVLTPGVPAAISAVIMKLLAKTPEDRYQTAAGVDADLRRCMAPYHLAPGIEPFALAAHDIPDILRIPETLYGRDQSVQSLFASFERVASEGESEMVLVSGYPGVGKSSVVNELQRALNSSKAVFAAGKCDQFSRDIPYATLAQALQTLARMILRSSEAELARWRDSIRRAVGPNGQLIVDLVPELELVIGKQGVVPELPPQDSLHRFQMVFREFLHVFTRPDHPLVLFLDDLQWIDRATLALVEDLTSRRETRHLLLIGAYRDNEVDDSHPLSLTLDTMRKTETRINEISLSALGSDDLCRLMADTLHCSERYARPLAEVVAEKTGGNPFFAIQFLTELGVENLLSFDADTAAWSWQVAHIQAKSYTDNVVELLMLKFMRLPGIAQDGMKELACLGSSTEIATLAIVRGSSEAEVRAALFEATKVGLVVQSGSSCRFAHDRVQEAAYALIPQELRPGMHLRIGRRLMAANLAEPTAERVFAVVNQLNRAVDLIGDPEERKALLRLNVLAGAKAKAGIAYGAARDYLVRARALVPADGWTRHYEETLELHLNLAECEYLVGGFESADRLFDLMLANARCDLDRARIYSLHMKVCQVGGGYDESLVLALDALALFGVRFPDSDAEIDSAAEAEFRAVSANLGERRIGDLLDAPIADSPEVHAIIDLLVDAVPSAYNGRPKLFPLMAMKAVNFSLIYGNTYQSSYAYAVHAMMLVGVYGEMAQAFEFSEMALRLNEKFGNARLRGTLLHLHGDHVAFWRQPFVSGVPILEQGLRACLEVGDLVYAGHLAFLSVWQAIERGEPLEAVRALAVRNAKFADESRNDAVHQTIQLEQQFIASLQGRTSDPLKFDAAGFDERAAFAAIEKAAFGCGIVFYPIMKQILAYLHGRHSDALDAARVAEPDLGASMATPIEATHHFYHALTLTALYATAPPGSRAEIDGQLEDKLRKLELWADNCPQNYQNRCALVRAEIARIGGRTAEAMDLYEEAIRSARENGFIQNEALAFELAAQFYAARGFATFALLYLRNARSCYLRWGAEGKVRQLDELHAQLHEEAAAAYSSIATADTVEHLDLGAVMKVSEAVSGEIVLEKLIDTLMRTAIEHAGAERGLLVLLRGEEYRVEAEATTRGSEVMVDLRQANVTGEDLPDSVFRYVLRTKESVLLPDASAQNAFAADPYILNRHARSVLCLPILKQTRLLGVLYLENNLAPRAFTPARISILKVLASEAAISMENALLYRDLAEREGRIRRLVDANIIGIVICDVEGRIHEANDAFLRMVGYDREDLVSQNVRWTDMTPPEWRERDQQQLVPELKTMGRLQPFEKEFFRKDGSRVPVLIGVANFEEDGDQGVAFVLDLSERKRAADAMRGLQMELAHANRLATMGQLVATIAHEVNQPIGATRNNAHAALRFLDKEPPNIADVREALECVVNDTYRAGDIVGRIRAQIKKLPPRMEAVGINEAIMEVLALVRGELSKNRVSVRTRFGQDLPAAHGDRVQLQQVVLNLVVNAIEAMAGSEEEVRQLVITTASAPPEGLLIFVADSGPGVEAEDRERIFESFYTSKTSGLGIGLSICRSIIEAHGGRLWADAHHPRGTVFKFTMPAHS